jgi:hypothetical protein
MMNMITVREDQFHNGWQYTNVNQIWQEAKSELCTITYAAHNEIYKIQKSWLNCDICHIEFYQTIRTILVIVYQSHQR